MITDFNNNVELHYSKSGLSNLRPAAACGPQSNFVQPVKSYTFIMYQLNQWNNETTMYYSDLLVQVTHFGYWWRVFCQKSSKIYKTLQILLHAARPKAKQTDVWPAVDFKLESPALNPPLKLQEQKYKQTKLELAPVACYMVNLSQGVYGFQME